MGKGGTVEQRVELYFHLSKNTNLPKKLIFFDLIVKVIREQILWYRPCPEPFLLPAFREDVDCSLAHPSEALLFSLGETEWLHLCS